MYYRNLSVLETVMQSMFLVQSQTGLPTVVPACHYMVGVPQGLLWVIP